MKELRILVPLAALFAAAFFFYIKPNYLDAKDPVVYTPEDMAAAPRPTLTLEERVLNLNAPPAAPRYVKLSAALEFEDPNREWLGLEGEALASRNRAFAEELKPEVHRIWDVITAVVGSKTIDQVATPEGRDQLKVDLVNALNDQLHSRKVADIYFVTFITQ